MKSYPKGFHVYFEKIKIEESDSIFRIAQYIAFGLFHNSQIRKIDSSQKNIVATRADWLPVMGIVSRGSGIRLDIWAVLFEKTLTIHSMWSW